MLRPKNIKEGDIIKCIIDQEGSATFQFISKTQFYYKFRLLNKPGSKFRRYMLGRDGIFYWSYGEFNYLCHEPDVFLELVPEDMVAFELLKL